MDKDALKDIENAIGIYDSVIHTDNEALNVILTEKSMLCEKDEISLTCMIESGNVDFMAPSDIYSLFGNALDNAIEAVCKIESPDYRNISVNVKRKGNFLAFHIENYFKGDLVLDNGIPRTIKSDKNSHGFGMKSMKMIAEKYKGNLAVEIEQNVFHLTIIIPIPKVTDFSQPGQNER